MLELVEGLVLDQDQDNEYVPAKKKAARIRSQESIHRFLASGKLPRYPKSRMNVPAKRRRKKPLVKPRKA